MAHSEFTGSDAFAETLKDDARTCVVVLLAWQKLKNRRPELASRFLAVARQYGRTFDQLDLEGLLDGRPEARLVRMVSGLVRTAERIAAPRPEFV